VFKAAVEVSRPLLRCRGCYRTVIAAVKVFKAAVEVLRLLLRCRGCCEGIKAPVKVSRPPTRCQGRRLGVQGRRRGVKAAVEVFKAAVEVEAVLYRGRYRGLRQNTRKGVSAKKCFRSKPLSRC
jgi:hypothetical protein